jgi:aminoglycoside phosphotransferase (APT) family kinase protein
MAGRVEQAGNTVRRPMGYWSPAVHELLRYLESTDFPAPRVLQTDGDTEVLTWIDGEAGPASWAKVVSEAGLRRWARFLRRYHDAVAGYRPPAETTWSCGARACSPAEIICHGDFGPWNGVWQGNTPAGLIDWDHARPAMPMFDVAYALEYTAPFRCDQECMRWLGYPRPPDRRQRIEVFCEAYGIAVPDDVAACVAEQQRLVAANCEALARHGIEPQATWVRQGHLDQLRLRILWTESSGL